MRVRGEALPWWGRNRECIRRVHDAGPSSPPSRSGANADRRDAKCFDDFPCEVRGNALQHHRESTELFESGCLADDIPCRVVASTLDSKAPVGVNGLRLETQMTHDRYPTLSQSLNHILMPVYTLKLYCMCAGGHDDMCGV